MTTPASKRPLELPPEAEPARAFIEALVERFETRIRELERQIEKLTPRNSSLPPSSEHPHAKPKRKPIPKANKRKPGGQKGHQRSVRPLVPTEQCNSVTQCIPEQCRRCGGPLAGTDSEPLRHQVYELPEIKPLIHEYQLHRRQCSGCGITTCGVLPADVPTTQCGPRLAAFTGLLMVHFRQSKRRAAAFLSSLLNIPCSPAWTVKIQNQVASALAAPHEELRSELGKQPQLFVDESPTKQKHVKAWLWVAVAPKFAVFGVYLNRKRQSLQHLIGDYSGIILNCDRAKMYMDGKRLQWCWAHLKRDLQKLIDYGDGQGKRLGQDLLRQQKRLFEKWRERKAGELDWLQFQREVEPIRAEFNSLLLRGCWSGNKQLIGICRPLHARRDWLWTFVDVEGIEPTNNTAERALRPAVIYRKLSFGTQSEAGSRFVERMLTISETCRLQGKSVFTYLTAAMKAKDSSKPIPSLLSTAVS